MRSWKSSIAPDHSRQTNSKGAPALTADKVPPSVMSTQEAFDNTKEPRFRELVEGLYYWMTCVFIIGLVFSQLLGAVWDSRTTEYHTLYGRSPLLGASQIVGSNDVPYTDRVIACVRKGNLYHPRLVSSLLADTKVSAILEDSSGTAIHGYRLKQRREVSVTYSLDSTAQAVYESSCALIANTIENIFNACVKLGYTNLTHDNLHIVDDWDSKNMYLLRNTLPVLIMPFWDNAPYAREAIPTWGGDACIFRLEDAYTQVDTDSEMASFRGVNQSVRHERTMEWLSRPGGVWKNGWYEDLEGMKWYSDVQSSAKASPYDMMHRLFDMRTGKEVECSDSTACEGVTHFEWWGDKFSAGNHQHDVNSVYIANATEFGLFIYESHELRIVKSVFDWQTLLSNVSVALILFRWVLTLVSLHTGALQGKCQWFSGGIGCISGAKSFAYLPLVSLPRLKMTLAAFWTVGCAFEGQQIGLSEAWFAVYPAIVHLVLIYYSILNTLAKILRRRISDVLFTPTVISLCLMHYFRLELATSGWLKGIDGRVATVVFSDEVRKLKLVDYLTTDAAWRMNGRVTELFGIKLGILVINLFPLLFARSRPIATGRTGLDLHGVEKALALRVTHVGGFGCSLNYIVGAIDPNKRHLVSLRLVAESIAPATKNCRDGECKHDKRSPSVAPIIPLLRFRQDKGTLIKGPSIDGHCKDSAKDVYEIRLVNSYELTRLGYLVFGDKYLITFDDWDLLSPMAPLRSFWNHRVIVWTLRAENSDGDAELMGGRALECAEPQLWRLNDPRLEGIRWWQVSSCSIKC